MPVRIYKDAVAAWEAKTGNKVDDSSATSDETFKSRVITDFEAGSEPDVLFYFDGVDSNQFVEQGKVVSIDEIRQTYPDYASNMKDDMLPESPADGVKYAVPVNGYWEGMFVNKAVCLRTARRSKMRAIHPSPHPYRKFLIIGLNTPSTTIRMQRRMPRCPEARTTNTAKPGWPA